MQIEMTQDLDIGLLERGVLSGAEYLISRLDSKEVATSWRKHDFSLVTELDIAAGKVITEVLNDGRPIICEEDPASHSFFNQQDSTWLVDPLDGTTACKRFASDRNGNIGFGPLVSLVEQGQIQACSFYHISRRSFYTAVRGKGAWWIESDLSAQLPPLSERHALRAPKSPALKDATVLFYPGSSGEIDLVAHMQRFELVEELHHFGGIANDCVRLAHGFEHVQIHFKVKPWDFSAVLFGVESGLSVLVDPLKKRVKFSDWRVEADNPVLVYNPCLEHELMVILEQIAQK